MAHFNFVETGLIDYQECWDRQEELLGQVVRDRSEHNTPSAENYFLLVEHPHVYTLGKSGDPGNMLIPEEFLKKIGATFYRINRGGDITYHGPGQLVGYLIMDLDYFRIGIREFIWKMEESIISTIGEFGLQGARKDGATGVWLDTTDPARVRKICAIGVRVSHFVTMHGFALNVNTNLNYFHYINPCGFASSAVTSLQKELGREIDMEEVKTILKEKFNGNY
jgi:lipoyl(octanoyl) transferase